MQTHHEAHLVAAKYLLFSLDAWPAASQSDGANTTVLRASNEPKAHVFCGVADEICCRYLLYSIQVTGFLSNAHRGPAETARGPTLPVSIGSLPSILVPSLSVPARATGKNSNALPMPCHALPRPATPCHARAGPRQLPHPAALPREGREPRPHKARLLRKDW